MSGAEPVGHCVAYMVVGGNAWRVTPDATGRPVATAVDASLKDAGMKKGVWLRVLSIGDVPEGSVWDHPIKKTLAGCSDDEAEPPAKRRRTDDGEPAVPLVGELVGDDGNGGRDSPRPVRADEAECPLLAQLLR